MKNYSILLFAFLIFSCQSEKKEQNDVQNSTVSDTTLLVKEKVEPELEMFSNEAFKNVSVQNLGSDKFMVKGQARVFEATINWSVEDGHYILADGFATADMGAPEWGNFAFEFSAKKAEANSTMVLILFEASAKDGTQMHTLPIKLQ